MRDIYIVCFRLGAVSPEPLPKLASEGYLGLSTILLNSNSRLQQKALVTIPISNDTIQQKPSLIYSILLQEMDKAASADLILVDVHAPARAIPRGALLLHLAIAVNFWG